MLGDDSKVRAMKVLAIISRKGGVGKTTLATALAVEAVRAGRKPVIFDLDPQASASFWKDTRNDDRVALVTIPAVRLKHMIKAAAEGGADLAIIDTPPHARDDAFEAASQADFVLIPTRPAVLDVMAIESTLRTTKEAAKPSSVVLNFCPPSGREVDDCVAVIQKLGAEVCPARIGNRIAYSRAQQNGLAAQETDPASKAASEIKELYAYVCMHLYADTVKGASNGRKRATGRS